MSKLDSLLARYKGQSVMAPMPALELIVELEKEVKYLTQNRAFWYESCQEAWKYRDLARGTTEILEGEVKRLMDEIESLRRENAEYRASRIAYASEFPLDAEGEPDVGSIHENIRALKARVPDPNALRLLLGAASDVLKKHGEDRDTGLADAASSVLAALPKGKQYEPQ